MPYKVIDGNLLDSNAKYICHQVNCQGRMGSGVAKQIRAKYPEAYSAYTKQASEGMLGEAQLVDCHDGKVVVNMFAQSNYGYDGNRYTSYVAFQKCLDKMIQTIPAGETIAMPYMIGCGLGGGEWEIISDFIVEKLVLDNGYNVEFWRLPANR